MAVIKKSSWGGKRKNAGRKPRTEYESREMFKTAFDKVITPEAWEVVIRESWESKNWSMIKFLIEQRIGKAVDLQEQTEAKKDIRIILGDYEVDSESDSASTYPYS